MLKNLTLPKAVAAKFQQAVQQHAQQGKIAPFSIPREPGWNLQDQTPCRFRSLKGTVNFLEALLQGYGGLKVQECRDNGDGKSVTVVVSAQNLKADLLPGFAIAEFDNPA